MTVGVQKRICCILSALCTAHRRFLDILLSLFHALGFKLFRSFGFRSFEFVSNFGFRISDWVAATLRCVSVVNRFRPGDVDGRGGMRGETTLQMI
jgi:hypothetical protein